MNFNQNNLSGNRATKINISGNRANRNNISGNRANEIVGATHASPMPYPTPNETDLDWPIEEPHFSLQPFAFSL